MEYYSTIKGKEVVLLHATTWVNLTIIMLNERSQTQKTTYIYDSIYMKCPEKANMEIESRQMVD